MQIYDVFFDIHNKMTNFVPKSYVNDVRHIINIYRWYDRNASQSYNQGIRAF